MEFKYEAINREGQSIAGQMTAPNVAAVMQFLREQDLVAVRVEESHASKSLVTVSRRATTAAEVALVVRELATLLAAGVSLAEAVESTAQARAGSKLGSVFAEVFAQLRSGADFSTALREGGLGAPEYLYQLVEAGEMTGKLAASLQSAADQMDYEQRVRAEMRNALIYPAVLVISGILATLLIFVVVVPKFSNMLKSSRGNLPDISVWVLKSGLFVKDNLAWFGFAGLAVVLGVVVLLSNRAAKRQLLEWAARLPVLGEWLVNAEIGRWASMLGSLLANKVAIVRAMELAESGVELAVLSGKLKLAVRDLRAGKKLADSLAVHRTVNPMGINLVRVGERTGELPAMLKTLGSIYETASRERMKRFLILFEPAAILIVGSVIGFIMIAIMLAITSISTVPL